MKEAGPFETSRKSVRYYTALYLRTQLGEMQWGSLDGTGVVWQHCRYCVSRHLDISVLGSQYTYIPEGGGVILLIVQQTVTLIFLYSETCLNRTPYIPETWTNGK